MLENPRILIVAAHPDDEVLGCGGTIAQFVSEGYQAFTLIFGEGITSRDFKRDIDSRQNELTCLKRQLKQANDCIGVQEIFMENYPDNRLDTVSFLDIVKKIEDIKRKVKPKIIFTHHRNDLNIDHQIIFKAVLTATRPLVKETVQEIYAFETISSTEWSFPLNFSPNLFFDISKTLQIKLNAMSFYQSELRDFPHSRSLKGIELTAQNWGMKVGLNFAEAFEVVRIVKPS